MYRSFCLAILAGLVLLTLQSAPATAVDCVDPDLMGMLWPNGEFTSDAPLGTITGTLYLFNPSNVSQSIAGWEVAFDIPDNIFLLNTSYYGMAINVLTPPEYAVGLASPLTVDPGGMIALADISFFIATPLQADFFIGPVSIPSVPGEIVYVDGEDYGILIPMEPVSGSFAEPISRLNGPDLPWCPGTPDLDLSVGIAARGDDDNLAATWFAATDGYDEGVDLPEGLVNSHVWFPHPEWGAPVGDNFRYDVKAVYDPLLELGQWTFVVEVDNPATYSTTVNVAFDPSFTASDGIGLEIFDQTAEVQVPLFPSLEYSYTIPAMTLDSRTFDLFIGNQVVSYDLDVVIDAFAVGGPQDLGNRAGTSPDATDGYDSGIDIPEPPPPPSNFISAFFPHTDWPLGDRYMEDIRAVFDPFGEFKAWEMVVETDHAGTVQLDFTPNFSAGEGIGLQLWDTTTGQLVDLFPSLSYAYADSGGARTFYLYLGNYQAPTGLMVQIDSHANGYQDNGNLAATEDGATDGFDALLDIPDAPPPPTDFVSTYFPHPDWPLGSRYRTDVRAVFDPLNDLKTWSFNVETDQSGSMTLDFMPNFEASDGVGLRLRDQSTGVIHNLFPDLTYSYLVYGGPSSRGFDLLIGTAAGPPPFEPPARELAAGWSLIGFPLIPAPPGLLADVIFDDVPSLAYLYRYLGAAGYDMAMPEDPVIQGQGLWIATDQPFTWSMEGDFDLDGTAVPLRDGWTLVGYPMWFPGALAGVKVDYNGSRYDWWQAVSMNIVSGIVYDYNTFLEGYVIEDSTLVTWRGYWMAGLESGVALWFEYPNFVNASEAVRQPDESQLPQERRWRCVMAMDDGLGRSAEVTFGVSDLATAGFDAAFDYPAPPTSPAGPRSSFTFQRPEWELSTGDAFISDIIKPTENDVKWNALVRRPEPGPVVLSWDAEQLPGDADFQIYLPGQNRVVVMSMREQSSVEVDVLGQSLAVQIRTPDPTTGVDDLPPVEYSLSVQPNPFNPMTRIAFDLVRPAHAEVRIFDIRGQMVRQLNGGVLPAGRHDLTWRGRDESGQSVASGIFFAVLYADGQRVGPIQKMSLVR